MKKLYCGGSFCFDYQKADYREQAAADYRSVLLGSPDLLLQRSSGVPLGNGTTYIGPFYFESDGMPDTDIVRSEIDMVKDCSDAIFLLDSACCPGTICELTMASVLGKAVHIFYLQKPDDQETESSLHTPCWYPILHSSIINQRSTLYPCSSIQEAAEMIRSLVDSWQK